MSGAVELVGGPLDGFRPSMSARAAFVWIDVRRGHICYRRPGKYRVLYRKDRPTRYLFAANTHALCGGCGAVVERVDGHVVDCSLCGGRLVV